MIATSRRFFAVCLLLLSIIFLTVSLPGCDTPPGSGSIDGVELGLHLRLHLEDLARQEDGLDPERLSRARALFDRPPQGLDSLRIYDRAHDPGG